MRSSSKFPAVSAEATPVTTALIDACISVLDDDPSMLKAVERLLKSEGWAVQTFSAPSAFLAQLDQTPCPVAILDVWMPEMNGLQVQEVLRRRSSSTRIIFLSGRDDSSVRQTALEAGAVAFLAKPFDDEVLLRLVQKALAA